LTPRYRITDILFCKLCFYSEALILQINGGIYKLTKTPEEGKFPRVFQSFNY